VSGFLVAAGFVVAVCLEQSAEQVAEAGVVDGFDEVLAQVDGRDELDAVIAEPLDDADQGQDSGHGTRSPVAQRHPGLVGVGHEGSCDGAGVDDRARVSVGFELCRPRGDGRRAVQRPGW
jgi:hypothetical protein